MEENNRNKKEINELKKGSKQIKKLKIKKQKDTSKK